MVTYASYRHSIATVLCILAIVSSNPAQAQPDSTGKMMTVTDLMFEKVPLNSTEPNDCSPQAPSDPWTGIVIKAPQRIFFQPGLFDPGKNEDGHPLLVPVCGFYRLAMTSLIDGKPLTLVAVSLIDNTRYSGPMLDEDDGLMEPTPESQPVDLHTLNNMKIASYFNANLARDVKIPAKEGSWLVHAEYGGSASNSVRIEVQQR